MKVPALRVSLRLLMVDTGTAWADPLPQPSPIPVFLPEKSQGQRSLVVHRVAKLSDMTEHTQHRILMI